jgi:hypothetical protein
MGGFSVIDFGSLFLQRSSSFWWLTPLFAFVALLKSDWFRS